MTDYIFGKSEGSTKTQADDRTATFNLIKPLIEAGSNKSAEKIAKLETKIDAICLDIAKINNIMNDIRAPLIEAAENEIRHDRTRSILSRLFLIVLFVFFLIFVSGIPAVLYFAISSEQHSSDILREFLRSPSPIVLLPLCIIFAFFVVLLLRTTQGPISFKVGALEFKGASGPILMWVLCFSALILGLHTIMPK